MFGISLYSQTDPDFSKNDPDKTAFLYNETKNDSIPSFDESLDSLKVAFKNLKQACSELIDVTVGRTNTYQGIVKDTKKLKKKIEKSKLYKDINDTETIKGIKKDIEKCKKSTK